MFEAISALQVQGPCSFFPITRALLYPAHNRWHGVLHNTVLNMATLVTSSPEMLEAALKGGLLQANTTLLIAIPIVNMTLCQAITAAARQDMQDGKRHRLPYMAQVVKIVVALKDTAKNVGACQCLQCFEVYVAANPDDFLRTNAFVWRWSLTRISRRCVC
jgi:hypothetical protein